MAKNLKLRDLKKKTPQELLVYAEELGVENASSMRTQDMLFEILKTLASDSKDIDGEGVLEVLQDGNSEKARKVMQSHMLIAEALMHKQEAEIVRRFIAE